MNDNEPRFSRDDMGGTPEQQDTLDDLFKLEYDKGWTRGMLLGYVVGVLLGHFAW